MLGLLQKVGAVLGLAPSISEIDHGIIEAMIEIGAGVEEIVETFGYSIDTIEAVRATQQASPYRVLASSSEASNPA